MRRTMISLVPALAFVVLGLLLFFGGAWLDADYLSTFLQLGGAGLVVVGVVVGLVTTAALVINAARRRPPERG